MVLARLRVVPAAERMPPPSLAELPATVQLTRVKVAWKLELMAPPWPKGAVLAVNVQLVRATVPSPMDRAPPPPRLPLALLVLWSKVLPRIVKLTPGESMAPPLPLAVLPVKVQSMMICVLPPTNERAPPLLPMAWLLLNTQRVRVRFAFATSRAPAWSPTILPSVRVRSEMLTVALLRAKTREAWLPLMLRRFALGPVMVRFLPMLS